MSKGINKNIHKLSGVYEIRNTLNNSGCCSGDRKEAKGYIWKYKTDNYPNKIKPCLEDRYKNNKKAVYQIDPVTEEIIAEYSSTKEAAMQFSKSTYSSISLCCNGKYKTAFGFKWKYKN